MFDSVRKHQRIFLFIIVVLIFPAFAFFGIQGYDQFLSDGDSVARVNGDRIPRSEFEQAQREQFDRIRQMLGNSVDPQQFDTPSARRDILEGLIDQRVLLQHARDNRIAVSDERLRDAIASISGLQGPDGRFDIDRYRAFVASRGRTEMGFEAELRRDTMLREIPGALAQSVMIPQAVLQRLARIVAEKREISDLVFKPESFAAKVVPDEAALKKFYEDNRDTFRLPESASVQYAVLDVEAIAGKQTVSDADIKSFYDQNRTRYGVAEERRARHILIRMEPNAAAAARETAQKKANELLDQLRKGARFDDLARRESQDPGSAKGGGDLDFFTREMMTKPFADAAFAAVRSQVVGPVETEFGLHLIEVTDIRPARERTLSEARGEIETEIRKVQASRKFAEDADAFGNMAYEQSDSLQPLVERFGVSLQQATDVTRGGAQGLARDHPLNHPRVLAALFSADSVSSRRNTEAVDAGSGRIISARLVEHRPSRVKPYDEVSTEVRQALVQQESARLAREAGEARLRALQEGGPADGLSAAREVSRSGQQTLPPAAMQAIFRAPVVKLPVFIGVDLGEQGYAVYRLSRAAEPEASEVEKLINPLKEQLEQGLSQQDIADYVESLKQRATIKRSLSRLGASNP